MAQSSLRAPRFDRCRPRMSAIPTRFPPVGIAEITQLAELAEDLLERARNVALEPSHVKEVAQVECGRSGRPPRPL